MTTAHKPVLLAEAMAGLAIKPQGIYVDATFGRGGHSKEMIEHLGPSGRLLAFDKDPAAILVAEQELGSDSRFEIQHASFAELKNQIEKRGLLGQVNGVLMDLGVSSPQLDQAERGFSFTKEGPLDMRMNPQQGVTAAHWLNSADVEEVSRVLREYGEERHAWRIANAIVDQRQTKPFKTTQDLVELINRVSPTREQSKHPATRSFQAIRIHINRELDELKACLLQCLAVLAEGGRLCVISFHSLEDRIVKQFIHQHATDTQYPPDLPVKANELTMPLQKVGKLIRPSVAEVNANPRARSARLRIAERIT
ncbi:MAG: 16S rRNA (cytosine(1402)-N(4))-methyltransferase RsmH [Gammaproteobacteria bacterium]|nr:16S rRNA (cytosine(1402)-N(4))-methyltransferase RsmH [Gammaproteobacteria bacterium]